MKRHLYCAAALSTMLCGRKRTGFAGSLFCAVTGSKRSTPSTVNKAFRLLRRVGYRGNSRDFLHRFHTGVSLRAAMTELDLLERAMDVATTRR